MSEYTYDYPINIQKIRKEIEASSIAQTLEYMNSNEGDCKIVFTDNLSVEEEDVLEALVENHDIAENPTQKELDFIKYKKRAAVKNDILAEMASNNMERVRSGVWTVPQLISLTQDVDLKSVLDDVNTLSFELAVGKVTDSTNELMTEAIKSEYIAMLVAHFYN